MSKVRRVVVHQSKMIRRAVSNKLSNELNAALLRVYPRGFDIRDVNDIVETIDACMYMTCARVFGTLFIIQLSSFPYHAGANQACE